MQKSRILEIIKRHKNEIQSRFDVEKIGLFGSYTEERATEESDIGDIFVEFKKKNFDNLAGLWVYLEELFQIKVDLVYPRKGDRLLLNINKVRK
jgi:predicted nucleotidyltransferase